MIEYHDEDVVERVTLEDQISKLENGIESVLSEREKEILYLRYGLCGREESTQREIAKKYQISRSYVSRIEKKALLKLRRYYEQ